MKILWHSNAPWAATGYGNQTRLFTKRIRDLGHEVSISAFYGLEGAILRWDGMDVLPRGYDPYGGDVLPKHYDLKGADIAITLIDAWVYKPETWPASMRWVPWFPVDCEPVPPPVTKAVVQANERIVYSKFALRQIHNAGMDAHYVPHGVETNVFKPYPQEAAREAAHFPKDRFIVGIVGANKGQPARKAWPEMLQAFAEFHKKHDDALLYVHTNPTTANGGVNMIEIAAMYGLEWGKDVIASDPYAAAQIGGLRDEQMATLYSAFDVHLLASSGEGFGIPIVEAQACGCPVIVGDWTAMPELCFSGWKIPKSEAYPFYLPIGGYQFYPRVGAIVDALDASYEVRGNQEYRDRARQGAREYDADRVTEKHWKPVLDKIAAKIDGNHRVTPSHAHQWMQTGLYNQDGSISVPCITCGAELIVEKTGRVRGVREGGFTNDTGLEFTDPDGVEWIILREIERDYRLDDLGLTDKSVVVDIGAHVGIVSMYLAKNYGCKVYAFEPNQENFRRLAANTVRNGLDPLVQSWQFAVTGDGRKVSISTGGNSGGGNIYGDGDKTVSSMTLEQIIAEVGKIDLLKIDCEGAEFEILADPEILRGKVEAIRGEFHAANGDVRALVEKVKAVVPNTNVTFQGWAA